MFDTEPPADEGDDESRDPDAVRDRPVEQDGDERPEQTDEDEERDEEEPGAELAFEGFSYFPVDFESLLKPELIEEIELLHGPPISPFYAFTSTIHVTGPRKWYLYDHDAPPHEHVFLVADGLLERWVAEGREHQDTHRLNGDDVYVDDDIHFQVSETVWVRYSHITLRAEIVEAVMDADEDYVLFEAGTHIGYVYFPPWNSLDFLVIDEGYDAGVVRNPRDSLNHMVNPLDYFTPELRDDLLDLYEPWYEALRAEGVHPFSDLEDSRTNVNVHGTLEGIWFRDVPRGEETLRVHWDVINLIGIDNLHTETYWRVLEHEWNREHDLTGLFTEMAWEEFPEDPLYEGDPLENSRFYLLDGDLSAGVAKIIREWEWDPRKPDSADNHPARGRRRYLVYEVHHGDTVYDDELTIQGFETEREARDGFTTDMLHYRRDPGD